MRQTTKNERTEETSRSTASCQVILDQVNRAKEAILGEATVTLSGRSHTLRLAVNEAEALAWQTRYPHLVFPTLAAEKVSAVAAWESRQSALRKSSEEAFALAA